MAVTSYRGDVIMCGPKKINSALKIACNLHIRGFAFPYVVSPIPNVNMSSMPASRCMQVSAGDCRHVQVCLARAWKIMSGFQRETSELV